MKNRLINWDDDYAMGRWEGFGDQEHIARYALLGGLIHFSKARTLLDVGCGRGLLRKFIPKGALASYTGIDISQVAIDGITDRQPHERFICARVEHWQNDHNYEAIILNEILYYLEDPCEVLDLMHAWLQPAGVLIISIYRHPSWRSPNHHALKVARKVFQEGKFKIIDDLEIRARLHSESSWSILLARALSPGSPVLTTRFNGYL